MSDFNTLFPNFLNQCTALNQALMPVACVLFVVGIVASTVTGHRSPSAYFRTIGRTFGYIAVLASLLTWSNEAATAIDSTVKNTLQADRVPAGKQFYLYVTETLDKADAKIGGSRAQAVQPPSGIAERAPTPAQTPQSAGSFHPPLRSFESFTPQSYYNLHETN